MDLEKLKVLDLFSGIGGFSLGLERTGGFETVAFCEIDKFCQKVLKKHWPDVPIFEDVRTLNYAGPVDVIAGGFPCQDLSISGKQTGFDGERSSLYTEMLRIIGNKRPRYALFENVTELLRGDCGRWFAKFLFDLAAIGFDAEWHCIPASAIGAAHHRDRVWIIAYPNGANVEGMEFQKSLFAYQEESRRRQFAGAIDAALPADDYIRMRKDLNDVSGEMDRLKAYGNSVVPAIPEIIGHAILKQEQRSTIAA
jgi:DNA (cytosine-5)-methyltransferase 1